MQHIQHFFEYVVEGVSKLKQCGLKAQIAPSPGRALPWARSFCPFGAYHLRLLTHPHLLIWLI